MVLGKNLPVWQWPETPQNQLFKNYSLHYLVTKTVTAVIFSEFQNHFSFSAWAIKWRLGVFLLCMKLVHDKHCGTGLIKDLHAYVSTLEVIYSLLDINYLCQKHF